MTASPETETDYSRSIGLIMSASRTKRPVRGTSSLLHKSSRYFATPLQSVVAPPAGHTFLSHTRSKFLIHFTYTGCKVSAVLRGPSCFFEVCHCTPNGPGCCAPFRTTRQRNTNSARQPLL